MKDDRLEKKFDEYFDGVNISNDIIADAKASISPKRKILPKIMKFASIAASIVLVFAVAIAVMIRIDLSGLVPDNGMASGGNTQGTPPDDAPGGAPPSGASPFELYTDSDLVQSYQSAYSISSLNSSLKFIENLAYSYNSTVETCNAGYKDGKLALVTAEVSILSGFNRDETTVFVEFTDEKVIYSGLADYYDGKVYNYYDAQYYLTKTTAQNGEPEFKLYISYRGVKYYFSVRSTDIRAYGKYLNLVTKK
ncbi:MAG: hypothetical protein J1G05_00670 [Clostridiales bacterium]|nr:hypothetical protein [Clostridiales bacterium]